MRGRAAAKGKPAEGRAFRPGAALRRFGLRGLLVVGFFAALVVGAPLVLRSRFFAARRASFAVDRAGAHLAAGRFAEGRADLTSALSLQPTDGNARRKLADAELKAGNAELAFLEYQTLTELHPEDAVS